MKNTSAATGQPHAPRETVDWLASPAFVAYSPYETFHEQLQPKFMDGAGVPIHPESDNPDIEALWDVGRDAYKSLHVQNKDDFVKRYSLFVKTITYLRGLVERLVAAGRIVDKNNQVVTLASIALENREASEILSLIWQISETSAKAIEGEASSLRPEHFLFASLREIDNALVGMALDGRSTVSSTVLAVNALANAQAIESGSDELKAARRKMASAGGFARHRNDPKQLEKQEVYQCYLNWRAGRTKYKSKAQFARDMLDKYTKLESQKKIEDWVRLWDRQKKRNGTLQAG
jgi:hypothetical protein